MLKIRKVKTGSGKTAVQVVSRRYHQTRIVKHLGSARGKTELSDLLFLARKFIEEKEVQSEPLFPDLFTEDKSQLLTKDLLEIAGYSHRFAYEYLSSFYDRNGFDQLPSGMLRDLSLIRLIEPASKLRSLSLLSKYFDITISPSTLYKSLKRLSGFKSQAEGLAISFAKKYLSFDFSLVFYDVTTLYFETFKPDADEMGTDGKITQEGLRKCGFSKDGKSNQPQILVGLMVSKEGYPVGFQFFPGNKFEGHSVLPVILEFKKAYAVANLTVVADAAMLSRDNLGQLKEAGLNYIVGARMANLSEETLKRVSDFLAKTPGKHFREETEPGFLICDYSELRALKDKSDRNKQITKAQREIKDPGRYLKRSRFVEETTASSFKLNEELIKKDEMRDGLKGYYTNIKHVKSSLIITRYHDLWKIEKAFRIAKSDLLARPIFHYRRESIEAHLLIVFLSLCVAKSIELKTGLSIKAVRDRIWDVLDVKIQNKLTGETFIKRSPGVTLPEY